MESIPCQNEWYYIMYQTLFMSYVKHWLSIGYLRLNTHALRALMEVETNKTHIVPYPIKYLSVPEGFLCIAITGTITVFRKDGGHSFVPLATPQRL